MAMISAALTTGATNDGWMYGTRGRIHLPDFVFSHSANLNLNGRPVYHYEPEFIANGYNYEAAEVMRCIREGKTESKTMSLDESLVIMGIMDQIRGQHGFCYPGE
jgi:predicted dehydrogenase